MKLTSLKYTLKKKLNYVFKSLNTSERILEDSYQESDLTRNRIQENFTLIPNSQPIILPFSYEYFKWYYPACELNTKKWVADNLKSDWVCIDVGANIGYYSILFSQNIEFGHCYSFEPTDTFEILKKNLDFHGIENCTIYNSAVSNINGIANLGINKMWGQNPVYGEWKTITLDKFVSDEQIEKVDLIKIDTDGFEMHVLEGLRSCLEKFNPWLLIEFSYALNTQGYEVSELLNLLIELGYRDALILDDNNLLTKKDDTKIIESWSDSITLIPHKYDLVFEEEFIADISRDFDIDKINVNKYSKKSLEIFTSITNNLNNITILDDIEFENFFETRVENSKFKSKYGVNPKLKNRGPRMELNDAPYLRAIYKSLDPKFHLEFGTWEGFGVSLFCSTVTDGQVTTINLEKGEKLNESGVAAYSSSYYPERRRDFNKLSNDSFSDARENVGWIYRQAGYSQRVTQMFADSRQLKPENFKINQYDTIFIDGDHSKEGVISDTLLSLELAHDDTLIIWHDFTLNFSEYCLYSSTQGVLEAINNVYKRMTLEGYQFYWVKDTWILFAKRLR